MGFPNTRCWVTKGRKPPKIIRRAFFRESKVQTIATSRKQELFQPSGELPKYSFAGTQDFQQDSNVVISQ